ncbi:hypothetical protein HYT92_01645 [Candidatus Pacearchaeota archaeon]|nr:hypothetical protein [Candidatus Pacearchaeota archaeon]
MAKEIVEITRRTDDRKGLVTHLHFGEGFDILRKIRGVYKAEIITTKVDEPDNVDISCYKTTNIAMGAEKNIAISPKSVIREEYEEAVLAHFEAVNNFKQLYLNQP